jgi:transcription elongation factor/antiterminator RfaH
MHAMKSMPFDECGRRWFAARAKPKQEELALVNLSRQGFDAFLPRVRRPPSPKAKRSPKLALGPLFPGYVFVGLDIGRERWRAVNSTLGVMYLVRFGDQPAPLPVGLIERMRALSTPQGLVAPQNALQVGQTAKIVGGAFDGWIGQVQSLADSQQRVVLLIDLMSRATTVALPPDNVAAA